MNPTPRTHLHSLLVANELVRFVDDEVLPGTGIDCDAWWAGLDAIVRDLAPKNAALLAERDRLQAELDAWHTANPGPIGDLPAYRAFLQRIGYLVAPPATVQCRTARVDEEVAPLAGPQLVVPILNARYALNAANARWGSLYDALYGTDVIPESGGAEKGAGYNPVRGQKVIAYARHVLDQAAPLAGASHRDATAYRVETGADGARLAVALKDGTVAGLADPSRFVGHQGEAAAPSSVLLRHHGLHLDIRIDRNHPIGRSDAAGIADVEVEAA
jgi:malate synthase